MGNGGADGAVRNPAEGMPPTAEEVDNVLVGAPNTMRGGTGAATISEIAIGADTVGVDRTVGRSTGSSSLSSVVASVHHNAWELNTFSDRIGSNHLTCGGLVHCCHSSKKIADTCCVYK